MLQHSPFTKMTIRNYNMIACKFGKSSFGKVYRVRQHWTITFILELLVWSIFLFMLRNARKREEEKGNFLCVSITLYSFIRIFFKYSWSFHYTPGTLPSSVVLAYELKHVDVIILLHSAHSSRMGTTTKLTQIYS